MKKSVLILETSLRANSNSGALAQAFAQGAGEAGHTVETISLRGKTLGFCRGCLACQKTGHCAISDDAAGVIRAMQAADVLVFATPIYYYEMSGQMKVLLDRANPLYGSEYAFRAVYLLTAAADEDPETPARAVTGLGGWIACFEKAHLAGSVFAGGAAAPGSVAGHPALEEARYLGRAL